MVNCAERTSTGAVATFACFATAAVFAFSTGGCFCRGATAFFISTKGIPKRSARLRRLAVSSSSTSAIVVLGSPEFIEGSSTGAAGFVDEIFRRWDENV